MALGIPQQRTPRCTPVSKVVASPFSSWVTESPVFREVSVGPGAGVAMISMIVSILGGVIATSRCMYNLMHYTRGSIDYCYQNAHYLMVRSDIDRLGSLRTPLTKLLSYG